MNNETEIKPLVIIGSGPAALSAAIYTTREEIKTTIYEKGIIGGLAATTDWVDNYPGFPDGIEGMKLAENLQKQALRFGTEIEFGEVEKIEKKEDFISLIVDGAEVKSKAVLITTGSDYKKLGVPGEKEFYAKGAHYCATCDGAFYTGKRLVVVGGGNSAVQEAMFLTKFATHIDLLVRSDIKASEVLQRKLETMTDKITVHKNTTTDELVGENGVLVGVKTTNTETGKQELLETDGVFIFIGLNPNTGFLKGSGVELDEIGMIKTGDDLQTSVSGIFAAGDVRSGATMQIASAVGEGATAALRIREFLEHDHGK